MTVHNPQGEKMGKFVQEDLKSIINIKGELEDIAGNVLLPVTIKGFSGDFTLTDDEGQQWAHFYHGYFPHDDMHNDIVKLPHDLEEEQQGLLLAIICFLFLVRNK